MTPDLGYILRRLLLHADTRNASAVAVVAAALAGLLCGPWFADPILAGLALLGMGITWVYLDCPGQRLVRF